MTARPGKTTSGVDLDQPALNRLVDVLRQQLEMVGRNTRTPDAGARKLLVAFSGGADSTALLLAAVALSRREASAGARWAVRAAHVNHQLQPQAELWQRHCAAFAEHLDVDLSTLRVDVQHTGTGLEAAAREARYRALAAELLPDEWLLTAHHAEDQLETVLFRLARGTGPDGLAGVPLRRRFGEGQLVAAVPGVTPSTADAGGGDSG